MDQHDSTEVEVTYIVSRTLKLITTAGALKAAIGAGLVEPTDLDPDDADDATSYVFELLAESPSLERDMFLTSAEAELEDEVVTIEEVNEV